MIVVNLLSSSILQAFSTPVLTGLGSAGKLWETLRRSSHILAIWASQRMLFGIKTEEIQLTALKNFQGSKALMVAAEKIPLNVPNHRFET